MEKIKEPISKQLPPLVLYLDDIQELYEFLKETTKEPVVIETCGYRFISLDELSKFEKEKTNSFTIYYEEPYLKYDEPYRVNLYLYQNRGLIFINRGDVKAEGMTLPHL